MLKSVIKRGPSFVEEKVRNIYFSIPDKIRYGKVFRENYKLLQQSQYWSTEKMEEYQINELKKIIHHSYETVPYYNKLFKECGIVPSDIKDFRDMSKIPYLTKEIIQNNTDELLSRNYKKAKVQFSTTSGSTGTPMGIYYDRKYDTSREWAFISHMWSRVGYDIRKANRTVYLRGNLPKSDIYEYKNNSLVLSSYNLTPSNMERYIKLILEYKPDFIQAYPSSISILSDFINSKGMNVRIPTLKAIFCASENIYDFQRKSIENAFKTKVFSFYGHTEHACIGGECEYSNYYHLQSEYGYTELINEDNQYVKNEGELGEIVATGFNNYVMPFIRYKTADLAINSNEKCRCGRGYKLIKKVEGRKQDLIVTRKGNYIILDMVIASIHDDLFKNVIKLQFFQNVPGVCVINIVKKDSYSEQDEKKIYKALMKKLGEDMELEFKYLESIARTKRGKHRFLIQNLKL